MGKTTEFLKKVEQERVGKYTLAVQREFSLVAPKAPSTPTASRTHAPLLFGLTLGIILLAILGLNIKFFLMMQSLVLDKNITVVKLNSIAESLNENARRMDSSNSDMKQIGSRIKQIEQQGDVQTAALENLTKAKNTLFNRVNSLEVEISKLGIMSAKQQE